MHDIMIAAILNQLNQLNAFGLINVSLLQQLLPSFCVFCAFLRIQKLKSGTADDKWMDDGL